MLIQTFNHLKKEKRSKLLTPFLVLILDQKLQALIIKKPKPTLSI